MRCVFCQNAIFTTSWRSLKLGDEDLRELELLIMERLDSSPVIRNTGGARKIRFSPSSRGSGKSGAYRVIFGWFPAVARTYLLLAYGKNDQGNLTAAECAACRELMKAIENQHRTQRRRQ